MREGSFVMYTIKQVAEEFGVSDNTIRNWEKEFGDLLNIQRDRNGSRYYIQEDIENFRVILQLRSEGFGIPQIKKIFETTMRQKRQQSDSGVSKDELNALKEMLMHNQNKPAEANISRDDLKAFQEGIVQAVSMQFQNLGSVVSQLQQKIDELDSRMNHLLEAPKEESTNNIQEELASIKELQKSLQSEFQAAATSDLIKQQVESINNLGVELKEREDKFSQMVTKYREEVVIKHEDGKKGILSRIFGK